MAIDCTSFHLINVVDTCAIWNILSSRTLTSVALDARCHFSCTAFVYYEALYKPRTAPTNEDLELQQRLQQQLARGLFGQCSVDIADLQEIDILEKRRRLGKGELSSIVFARKAHLAFLTDDQKARNLAKTILELDRVQTTPKLFGWLVYTGRFVDSDKAAVIGEHEQFGGNLRVYLEDMYSEALRFRCLDPSTHESAT